MENEESIFIEYFGRTPFIKILDFLIVGKDFDYSLTEIADGAHVGWTGFSRAWKVFVEKEIVVPTRNIGKARLYKLNMENPLVNKIVKIHWEVIKAETDRIFENKGWEKKDIVKPMQIS